MGFLGDLFGGALDFQNKYDPIGSKLTDEFLDFNANYAEHLFDMGGDAGRTLGWDDLSDAGDHWEGMARKDRRDHTRQLSNAAAVAGALYGGGAYGGAASTLGSAGAGAMTGGSIAAGQGGSLGDIAKGAATGALGSVAGQYLPDLGGYAGVENPTLKRAVNSGLYGGIKSAAQGGSFGEGAVSSALPSLVSYGAQQFSPTQEDMFGRNYSTAPWAGEQSRELLGDITQQSYAPQPGGYDAAQDLQMTRLSSNNDGESGGFQSPDLTQFFSNLMPKTPEQFGTMAEGLMGMYAANRQRKSAKELLGMMGARRGAYESQLRNNLMRKDAASGRRSNYAGRETALLAELAKLDASNAPAISQINASRNMGLLNMLASGLRTSGKMGWFDSPKPYQQPVLPSLTSGLQTPSWYDMGNKPKLGGNGE